MDFIKEYGNIEFLNCFFAWYYKKYGFFKENIMQDPRINKYKVQFDSFFKKLLQSNSEETVDAIFRKEAISRGLDENFEIGPVYGMMNVVEHIGFSDEVWKWKEYMETHPTYIREIRATNHLGDLSFSKDDGILDFPVRAACEILNEKGYYTYWSSANREDFESRKGYVIQDKSVAYILIDSRNLSNELKEKLNLNVDSNFWGIATEHSDGGKYYGIWSEITSIDMLCEDLSKDLLTQALELPSIDKQHTKSC